tara:strand:- start:405 stop:959 length:555 start_codon:yes stop_codon:yes gene_type:complete
MLIPIIAAGAGYGAATYAGVTGAALAFSTATAALSGAAAGAEMQAAEYNENLAKEKNKQYKKEAENVRISGAVESGAKTQESEKIAARNRTQLAAGGLDVGTGTAADIGEEVRSVGALESMTILNNADRQAMGLEARGQNELLSAKQRKKKAKIGAFTTILTSAASGYGAGLSGGTGTAATVPV